MAHSNGIEDMQIFVTIASLDIGKVIFDLVVSMIENLDSNISLQVMIFLNQPMNKNVQYLIFYSNHKDRYYQTPVGHNFNL